MLLQLYAKKEELAALCYISFVECEVYHILCWNVYLYIFKWLFMPSEKLMVALMVASFFLYYMYIINFLLVQVPVKIL